MHRASRGPAARGGGGAIRGGAAEWANQEHNPIRHKKSAYSPIFPFVLVHVVNRDLVSALTAICGPQPSAPTCPLHDAPVAARPPPAPRSTRRAGRGSQPAPGPRGLCRYFGQRNCKLLGKPVWVILPAFRSLHALRMGNAVPVGAKAPPAGGDPAGAGLLACYRGAPPHCPELPAAAAGGGAPRRRCRPPHGGGDSSRSPEWLLTPPCTKLEALLPLLARTWRFCAFFSFSRSRTASRCAFFSSRAFSNT